MVTSRNLGVKTGEGFYKYTKGSKDIVVADYFKK
jgi:3-hydroxybutyryl-CoA dehydrogenase